jgi:hypothetical protein
MNWSPEQTLYVAVAYTNPIGFKNRRDNLLEFRKHMEVTPNVQLYVGEGTYNDIPFEVTSASNPNDQQFKIKDQLWHKENIINAVVSKFPSNWKYGAYVDGDLMFSKLDWASEAIRLLQHYEWVQLFSSITDLDSNHNATDNRRSFMWNYKNSGNEKLQFGAPGGAWAFKRSAFDATGGLLDTCILGGGDYHMMIGLLQIGTNLKPETLYSQGANKRAIEIWQRRASILKSNIGLLNCNVNHLWHGSKKDRGYSTRWDLLTNHKYDPYTDLFKDSEGIYQLEPNRIDFRDDIRKYFSSRNEGMPTPVPKIIPPPIPIPKVAPKEIAKPLPKNPVSPEQKKTLPQKPESEYYSS